MRLGEGWEGRIMSYTHEELINTILSLADGQHWLTLIDDAWHAEQLMIAARDEIRKLREEASINQKGRGHEISVRNR
jgi:hypothetical protein